MSDTSVAPGPVPESPINDPAADVPGDDSPQDASESDTPAETGTQEPEPTISDVLDHLDELDAQSGSLGDSDGGTDSGEPGLPPGQIAPTVGDEGEQTENPDPRASWPYICVTHDRPLTANSTDCGAGNPSACRSVKSESV